MNTFTALALLFGCVCFAYGLGRIVHFFYRTFEMVAIALAVKTNGQKVMNVKKGSPTFFLDVFSVIIGLVTIIKFI